MIKKLILFPLLTCLLSSCSNNINYHTFKIINYASINGKIKYALGPLAVPIVPKAVSISQQYFNGNKVSALYGSIDTMLLPRFVFIYISPLRGCDEGKCSIFNLVESRGKNPSLNKNVYPEAANPTFVTIDGMRVLSSYTTLDGKRTHGHSYVFYFDGYTISIRKDGNEKLASQIINKVLHQA
ncbi:hypothetical protein [Acidithiobacillus sp.]|uniref:hypothetical protein n=1 Tax=Acidithiobacillus sp. TaxID=1872118 RepID=UPI003D04756A